MKVFLNAIIFHTLLNLYVFWRGWKVLPSKKAYKYSFAGVFIIELLVYLLGFIFAETLQHEVLHYIMILGTSWMIFIMYMTMFLVPSDLVWLLSLWIKKIRNIVNFESFNVRRIYYCFSVVCVLALMIWGSYKFWNPVVEERDLVINKESPGVKKLRIVMVSDLHLGYLIDRDILKMYVDKINEQKPDLILMVGDMIDYDLDYLQEQHMEEEFKRLRATYGIYGCTGNHEYRLNSKEKIRWLNDEAGLTMLRDSVVKIADSFYLIGREDYSQPEIKKPLEELLTHVDKKYPLIVMDHQPYFINEVKNDIDVAFYGHTHDGQLFPNNYLVKMVYELSYGYKQINNTHIFVSSGLGLAGPQYRIGTQSEIVVVNVEFK